MRDRSSERTERTERRKGSPALLQRLMLKERLHLSVPVQSRLPAHGKHPGLKHVLDNTSTQQTASASKPPKQPPIQRCSTHVPLPFCLLGQDILCSFECLKKNVSRNILIPKHTKKTAESWLYWKCPSFINHDSFTSLMDNNLLYGTGNLRMWRH